MLDSLEGIVSQLSMPSLGLKLTSRVLSGTETVVDLEKRYWALTHDQVGLWTGDEHQQRSLLGMSFGCRIAFSFAARFDMAGCTDIRLVIMDGRVAQQPLPDLANNPEIGWMAEAIAAKYGTEAAENAHILSRILARTDYEAFRLTNGVLSERTHVLFLRSEQPPPKVQLTDLVVNVEVVPIPGLHTAALLNLTHGEPARVIAVHFDKFLQEREVSDKGPRDTLHKDSRGEHVPHKTV